MGIKSLRASFYTEFAEDVLQTHFKMHFSFAIKQKHLHHVYVYLYVIVPPFKNRMQNVTPSSDPSVTDDINLRDLQVDLEASS